MWCTSTPKDRRSLHGCRRCLGKELLLPSMALIGSARNGNQDLADVYLFPVMDIENCIDVPLSVLEAASCNLPIVTTEYGELTAFREQEGFLFIDALDSDSLNQALEKALLKTEVNNRQAVLEYDWKNSIMWYLSSARISRRSLKKSSETVLPLFARLMM